MCTCVRPFTVRDRKVDAATAQARWTAEGRSAVDPLTVAAGLAAVAGIGIGSRWRLRAHRAETEADGLRRELQVERYAACHDPLTGLPTRRAFYQLGAARVSDPRYRPLS